MSDVRDLYHLLSEAQTARSRMEVLQACNVALVKVIEARTELGTDEWNQLRVFVLERIEQVKIALEKA